MDPHHVDADPDSTYHADADPDSDFLFDADPDSDARGNYIPFCSFQKGGSLIAFRAIAKGYQTPFRS
jgi:hypothetical protein